MKNLLLKIFCVVPVLSLAGTLSGCATMFCGTSEDVKIESFPSGASVFLNGENVGKTPLEVEMNRDSHPLVVLKKDGYADTRLQIEQEWNGTTMLNLLFFPGIPFGFPITGWILDARSGATSEYTEDRVLVPLLEENMYQGIFYDGNVKVTNFNPSEKVLAAKDALKSSLEELIQSNLVEVRVQKGGSAARQHAVGMSASRGAYHPDSATYHSRNYRATGTAWMQVEIGDDGKISSFSCLRVQGHSQIKSGANKTLQRIAATFVAPEEAAAILPALVVVPVVYSKEN